MLGGFDVILSEQKKTKQDSCSKYALSKINKRPMLFYDVLWILI